MARDVKVAILADARDFERAVDQTVSGAQRMESAFERTQTSTVTNAGHLRRGFDDVDRSVRQVGDTTDRTRSVMANFAGNAIQDVPGITNSFGALNVAAGQFAEYASEGGIRLKTMASAIGPMLVATVAIQAITKELNRAAAAKAFNRKQVEDWTEAVREGRSALQAMVASAEDAGKLELEVAGNAGTDLVPLLDQFGLTVENFTQMTEFSREELLKWRSAMIDAGFSALDASVVLDGVAAAQRNMAAATESADQKQRFFNDGLERQTAALHRNTREAERNRDAIQDRLEAINESYQATNNLFDAEIAHRDSQRRSIEAQFQLNDAIAEHGRNSWEARQATDAAMQAMNDQAAAAAELFRQTAELNGETLSAGDLARIHAQALRDMVADLDANSPLRRAIEEHITALNNIPDRIDTVVGVRTILETETNRDEQIARNKSSAGGAGVSITINGVGDLEVAREVERQVTWATN